MADPSDVSKLKSVSQLDVSDAGYAPNAADVDVGMMNDPIDIDELKSVSQFDVTDAINEPNAPEENIKLMANPLIEDELKSISQLDVSDAGYAPNAAEVDVGMMNDPIDIDELKSVSQFDVTDAKNEPIAPEENFEMMTDPLNEEELKSISRSKTGPIFAEEAGEEVQGEGQYWDDLSAFDPFKPGNEIQGEVEYQYVRKSIYESALKKYSWMKTLPPDEDEKVKLTPELISKGLSDIGRAVNSPEMAYMKFQARKLNLEVVDNLSKHKHLRNVDLSENNLTDVQVLAPLRYLQVLNLEQNRITSFGHIPPFKWLQALNLKNNDLLSLDGIQSGYLTYLNLSNNYIFSAEYFNGLQFPNLLILELRSNELSSISEMELPKLRHLYICQNMLRDLYGLGNCPNLELIHARGNLIEYLTDFPNLPKLKYLNLRNNSMRRFTETAYLENSENIETIILTENPISQSERYRAEIAAVALSIKRLDKTIVTEAEKIEGRLLRSARMMKVIDPLEDDQSVLGEMDE